MCKMYILYDDMVIRSVVVAKYQFMFMETSDSRVVDVTLDETWYSYILPY